MRYLYTIHGRNIHPLFGFSRRQQGRQVRWSLDAGYWWVSLYLRKDN